MTASSPGPRADQAPPACEVPGIPLPQTCAQVWVILGGRLILAGNWNRQELGRWPEQIRPTVALAMGMITELEEHGADLGARHRVGLDDPDTAMVGVPLGITSDRAAPGQPGG